MYNTEDRFGTLSCAMYCVYKKINILTKNQKVIFYPILAATLHFNSYLIIEFKEI